MLQNIIFQNLCNFIKVWHQITLYFKLHTVVLSCCFWENESGLACFKGIKIYKVASSKVVTYKLDFIQHISCCSVPNSPSIEYRIVDWACLLDKTLVFSFYVRIRLACSTLEMQWNAFTDILCLPSLSASGRRRRTIEQKMGLLFQGMQSLFSVFVQYML